MPARPKARIGIPGHSPRAAPSAPILPPNNSWTVSLLADEGGGERVGFSCTAGPGGPKYVSGGGGREAVSRPGRRAITPFRGYDPLCYEFPLIIEDDFAGEVSVENHCRILERWNGHRDDEPTPPIRVLSQLWPVGLNDRHWYVNDLSETDVVREVLAGDRIRWAVTVQLWEAVDDDRISTRRLQGPPQSRVVHAKKGDSMRTIAKRELGDKRLSVPLAKFNGRSAPSHDVPFKRAFDVEVPIGKKLEEWRRRVRAKR